MRPLRQAGAVFILMLVVSSVASAQRTTRTSSQAAAQAGGFWELGADAGVSLFIDDPMTVAINIPVNSIRGGYYASNTLSIEPLARINTTFGKDQIGRTSYMIGVGVLYHLTPDRTKRQTYLRPMLAISGGGGPNSLSFTHLGFGAGMKRPMFTNRLASRAEVGLLHRLKNGPVDAETSINALLGFSIYTK